MRFTFLVAGIVTLTFLPSQTRAIQLDEVDNYGLDSLAQLDVSPPQKVEKIKAPAVVKKPVA